MAINLNSAPYFDDYDQDKNYVKILFKPGYAVQARELTQLQTAIINQLGDFGSHVFEEGAIVYNGRTSLENGFYFNFVLNTNVPITAGDYIVGQTTGARAAVLYTEYKFENQISVWYRPLNITAFSKDETVNVLNPNGFSSRGVLSFDSVTPFNTGKLFTIQPSVFFIKRNFVHIPLSTLYLYDEMITARLGISISETIATYSEDETLLDPALRSSNYLGPGADRYQIALALASKDFDPESDSVDTLVNEDFIELQRVVNNETVRKVVYTEYNSVEDTLARRTYDESGNYTVSPFLAKLKPRTPTVNEINTNPTINEDGIGNVILQVSQGKAYVQGYEFETIAPTNLILEKSRNTKFVNGAVAYYDYGNFIYVHRVTGNPSFTNRRLVNLRSNTNTIVGNAFISSIEYDSTVGSNVIYRLYLSGINFLGTNTFAVVSNVTNGATATFFANVSSDKYQNTVPYIVSSFNSTALVKTPSKYIKTFLDGVGASDTIWDGKISLPAANFNTSGNNFISYATINNATVNQQFVGSGVLSRDVTNRDYFFVVASNPGSGPAAGRVLTYDDGIRVTVTSASQLDVSYANATTVQNFGLGGGNQVNVYARIALSSWQAKKKELVSNSFIYTNSNITTATVVLPDVDGYELSNIIASNVSTSTNVDATSFFTFSTGQKDDFYDFATVSTVSTLYSNSLLAGSGKNIDKITINYKYFKHTGTGFFNVDSYTHATSNITYSEIPSYTASNGETVELSDVFDFRPTRLSNTLFKEDVIPVVDSDFNFDYTYYLARKDRLVALPSKKFKIIQGISAEKPEYPPIPDNSMGLYNIDIKPYTYGINDITLNYIDNKRYTMRDIGKIEKRVERVEYYTALTLLEKQAQESRIPSTTPGLDKFKSGIVVDPFTDHTTGDPNNDDYKCSIDPISRELKPRFKTHVRDFKLESLSNIVQNKNMVSLPYTQTEFISQKLASRVRNVNPSNGTNWVGSLKIFPASDSYVSVEKVQFRATKNITAQDPTGLYSSVDGSIWNNWVLKIRGLDETET